jgi:hypothetical protein
MPARHPAVALFELHMFGSKEAEDEDDEKEGEEDKNFMLKFWKRTVSWVCGISNFKLAKGVVSLQKKRKKKQWEKEGFEFVPWQRKAQEIRVLRGGGLCIWMWAVAKECSPFRNMFPRAGVKSICANLLSSADSWNMQQALRERYRTKTLLFAA